MDKRTNRRQFFGFVDAESMQFWDTPDTKRHRNVGVFGLGFGQLITAKMTTNVRISQKITHMLLQPILMISVSVCIDGRRNRRKGIQ